MTNTLGLYFHIPYCVHRCSYCDFYSITDRKSGDYEKLLVGIESQINQAYHELSHDTGCEYSVGSIFFGGGTPSLMPTEMVEQVLEMGDGKFSFQEGVEITLEANPETVTSAWVEGMRKTRVNRISLGAQSFDPRFLKALERQGSAESICHAVQRLTDGGFDRLSLDLIFGIPGQTWEDVCSDIENAARLGVSHLSFYQLGLKPGHVLYTKLPDEDLCSELYVKGVERLRSLGLHRYEISNFSVEGKESRHNRLYWEGGDFLGFGPSAASRLFSQGNFRHHKQMSDLSRYYQSLGKPWNWEATNRYQTILEATFLELRTRWGVVSEQFLDRYRYDLRAAKRYLEFSRKGWIEEKEGRVRLTGEGFLLADYITRELVDEDRIHAEA